MYSHDAKLRVLLVGLVLATILFSLAGGIQFVNAQPSTITIGSDGSIDPPTETIRREGTAYIFSADLNCSIRIQRNNILLNGANRTIQGPGSGVDFIGITLMASNVTLNGFRISGWKAGVYGAFNNNTVAHNFFTNNSQGISVYANSYVLRENYISNNDVGIFVNSGALSPQGDNNLIVRNQIANNYWAIDIMNSNGTIVTENNVTDNNVILTLGTLKGNLSEAGVHTFCLNNFVGNKQVLHVPFGGPFVSTAPTLSPAGNWDNDITGNYWSDYFSKNPNANEMGNSGIGDTPYFIEENTTWERNYANGTHQEGNTTLGMAVDQFPLVTPYNLSNKPTTYPSPSPSASPRIILTPTRTNSPSPSKSSTPTNSPTLPFSSSPSLEPTTDKPNQNQILPQEAIVVAVLVLASLGVGSILVARKRNVKN